MATIYITNNANSGTGSLRAAVAAAQEGDVITPDPTVFNADELVEITLNTGIETTVGLTLSAGKTRLRLKRSNNSGDRVLYAKTEAAYFHAEDVEFIGRIIAYTPEAVFRRCRVYGNRSNAPGIDGHAGSKISIYDCVVAGCRGAGLYNAGANSATTIVRSTVAGNAQTVYSGASTVVTKIDSIVDPVCSEAGFVAPPPDVVDVSETGVAIDWSGWDFRLLPTSPYATGATPATGEYDVEGNARGVLDGGATRYAVGAYEVVDSDAHIVTSTADSGNGSLRAIIADSLDGESIYFAHDVFPPGQTTAIALSSQLELAKNLTIDAGTPTRRYVVVREVEGVETEVVVTEENPAQDGETPQLRLTCRVALDGQNTTRIALTSSAVEKRVAIHGVAFQNGFAGSSSNGAGIYAQKTSVTLTECVFTSNSANYGGGFYAYSTSQNTLTECVFTSNSANYGGGFCAYSTRQNTLTECVFTSNSATNYGGGFCAYSTSQNTLTECVFTSNSATNYGGGFYATSTSQNTLTECVFTSNSANYGGGFYATSTSQNTLTECVFTSNSATNYGGGFYAISLSQNVFINSARFIDNEAATGSGFYDDSYYRQTDLSAFTLENCEYFASVAVGAESVIYFTTTADSGEGSLCAALASASQFDAVKPDPTVFPRGATITIPLASYLRPTTTVAIDGDGRRIRLDGQGASQIFNFSETAALVLRDVDLVGGYSSAANNGSLIQATLFALDARRCRFAGGSAPFVFRTNNSNTGARFYDSIVVGNQAASALRSNFVAKWQNCTDVGNYSSMSGAALDLAEDALNKTNVKETTAGLVAPPPATLDPADWTRDLWQTWNLHLLPDAADASGAVASDSSTDFDGNRRRENGAVGAYEALEGVAWSNDEGTVSLTLSDAVFDVLTDAPSTIRVDGVNVVGFFAASNAAITFLDGGALGIAELGDGTTITTTGDGYLALDPDQSRTDVVYADGVVDCDYGAGITAFNAYAANGVATLETTAKNENVNFLIEVLTVDGWETVTTEGTPEYTSALGKGVVKYRVYDGASFYVDNLVVVAPIWKVEAWGENLGGGGDPNAPGYNVEAWAVDPEIDHRQ